MFYHIICREAKERSLKGQDVWQHKQTLQQMLSFLAGCLQQQGNLGHEQEEEGEDILLSLLRDSPAVRGDAVMAPAAKRPRPNTAAESMPSPAVRQQLQSDYLFHIVKAGRAEPTYDAGMLENTVQAMFRLKLG